MWVNGKLLESAIKKNDKWKPPAPEEKKVWGQCADCGKDIYELESCWPMLNKTVCVWGGCHEKYKELGLGYHAPAGWGTDDITLTA